MVAFIMSSFIFENSILENKLAFMIIHNLGEENSVLNQFILEIRDSQIQKDAMRFRRNIERIGETVHITAPSSYLALSSLVSNILDQNIYESAIFEPKKLVINLPETSVVAENSGTTVIDINNKHYISLDGNTWSEYPAN